MYNLDLTLTKTIDLVLDALQNEDLTSCSPLAPWELLHRKNISNAAFLSKITKSPIDIHLNFTKRNQEMILRAKREGNTLETCAHLAKILPSTLKRWLDLGEKGISPYYEFLLEYNQSYGLIKAKFVRDLHYARDGKGAMFWLKCQDKDNWIEDNGTGKGGITITQETTIKQVPMSEMKPEEKRNYIEDLIRKNNKPIIDVE